MSTETIYWIDEKDVICQVSGPWDDFALENNGSEACANFVVGKPIWNFIVGDTARMWMNAIIGLSRIKRESVERQYRCDSPSLKRYMMMRLQSEDSNIVRVEHELLFTELMDPPMNFKYTGIPLSTGILRCSVCNKIQVKEGWYEPDEAVHKFNLVTDDFLSISYAVCEKCDSSVDEVLREA